MLPNRHSINPISAENCITDMSCLSVIEGGDRKANPDASCKPRSVEGSTASAHFCSLPDAAEPATTGRGGGALDPVSYEDQFRRPECGPSSCRALLLQWRLS